MAAVVHVAISGGDNLKMFYAEGRSEKLFILEDDPQMYSAAAFGSSHVNDGFDPESFEQAFYGTTNGPKSFNLALEGGGQVEQRLMAREFLKYVELRGGSNALIILELNDGLNFTTEHLYHPRAINIYDWSSLKYAATFSDSKIGPTRWLGRLLYAIHASVLHYLNVGMLSNRIFKPKLNDALVTSETIDDHRGLRPLPMGENGEVAKLLSQRPEKVKTPIGEIEPGHFKLLQDLYRSTTIKDVRFVYVVMPLLEDKEHEGLPGVIPQYPYEIDGPNGKVPIINLYDSGTELLQASFWANTSHLNESGAKQLAKILGTKLRSYYSAATN